VHLALSDEWPISTPIFTDFALGMKCRLKAGSSSTVTVISDNAPVQLDKSRLPMVTYDLALHWLRFLRFPA